MTLLYSLNLATAIVTPPPKLCQPLPPPSDGMMHCERQGDNLYVYCLLIIVNLNAI